MAHLYAGCMPRETINLPKYGQLVGYIEKIMTLRGYSQDDINEVKYLTNEELATLYSELHKPTEVREPDERIVFSEETKPEENDIEEQ